MDTLYKYEGRLNGDKDDEDPYEVEGYRTSRGDYRIALSVAGEEGVSFTLGSIDHLRQLIAAAQATLTGAFRDEAQEHMCTLLAADCLLRENTARLCELLSEGNTVGQAIDIVRGEVSDNEG